MENNIIKKDWTVVERIIDADNLGVKEKGLLCILYGHIDVKTGYANPSRETLKKLCHIYDNRTLDGIINSVVEKGYLTRISGKGTRSRYIIK